MAQSDSSDFEFDISDLEVEGNAPSAPKDGETVSKEQASPETEKPEQASESEQVSEEPQAMEGESSQEPSSQEDDELAGFDIDELPDAFTAPVSAAEPEVVSSVPESAKTPVGEAPPKAPSPEPQASNSRESSPKPMRALGEDDLGADVFEEIDTDSLADSFENVLEDLLDEVDDFEVGGGDDAEDDSGESSLPSALNLDDPDDSVTARSGVNPQPFEKPAAVEPEVVIDEQPELEPVVEEPEAVADEIVAPEEIPEAEPAAAQKPEISGDFEIPTDDSILNAEASSPVEIEPVDEVASESEVEAEPELPAEPAAAKGRENVLFSAEDEEPQPIENTATETPEIEEVADDEVPVAENQDEVPVSESESEASPYIDENAFFAAEDEESEIDLEAIEAQLEDEAEIEASDAVEKVLPESSVFEEEEDADSPSENLAEEIPDAAPDEAETIADSIASVFAEEEEEVDEDEPEVVAEVEPADLDPIPELSEEAPGLTEVPEDEEDAEADPAGSVFADEPEEELADDEELDAIPEDEPADSDPIPELSEEAPGLTEVPEEEEDAEADPIGSVFADEPDEELSDDEELDAIPEDEPADSDPIPELSEEAPGLTEVSEEDDEEVEAMPSAEDLLMAAGSLLNKDASPAEEASAMLDDDEDEIAFMPSPADLMNAASEEEDDDDEVIAMPDPSALIAEAEDKSPIVGDGLMILDDDDEEEEDEEEVIEAAPEPARRSGNIADNAGDLPPPPPAPIEIIDDDPPEEDVVAPEPVAEVENEASAGPEIGSNSSESVESSDDEFEIDDPFAGDESLESLDPGLDAIGDGEEGDEEAARVSVASANKVVEMPKPSLLWRVTHSMAIAAGIVLVSLGWVTSTWKQEIMEFIEGRDMDASGLIAQIRNIGTHAVDGFDENGLYRMQWIDSEVRHLSDSEIRLEARVGAQLRENLYEPVFESVLQEKFGYEEGELDAAQEYARSYFPDEVDARPKQPWTNLYRISASKDEILPLRVVYRIRRETEKEDWELAGIRVGGYKIDLEWPDGRPRHEFDEHAQDVDSPEFERMFSDYQKASKLYVDNLRTLKESVESEKAMLALENEKQRERVVMSLAQGAFFSGIAILGEDADDSKHVTMVITETQDNGTFVKGVFKGDDRGAAAKHFIGSIDFATQSHGKQQGILNVRTVAFESDQASLGSSGFFSPGSVSQIRLKTDGFRLEGDSSDFSLRMTRRM